MNDVVLLMLLFSYLRHMLDGLIQPDKQGTTELLLMFSSLQYSLRA